MSVTTSSTAAREDRREFRANSAQAAAQERPGTRSLSTLSALWPYLKRRPATVGIALVFLVAAAAATLSLPLALGDTVDALSSGDREKLNGTFRILGGLAIVLAVLSAVRFYFVSRFGERVAADLRSDLYRHMMKLSPRFFLDLKTGEAVSRLTADITLIESFFGSSLSIALRTILTVTGSLAMMFVVNWQLAGMLVVTIPLAIVPILVLGRTVRARSARAQDRLADAASEASETLESIELVQAFGEEGRRAARFAEASEAAFQAAVSRILARALLTAFAIVIVFGATVLVLWMGATSVARGDLSGGELTEFLTFAVFAASGSGMLSEIYGDAMRAAGAAKRAQEIFATEPEITAPASPSVLPQTLQGAISFDSVRFSYGDAGNPVLNDLSFDIAPGEMVALVGPSGAGKSTIFRLLLRLFDPDEGTIRLDGVSSRAVDPAAWRKAFAYVPQETALFSGTVAENIAFGSPGARADAIEQAAVAAEVKGFADAKGGLDTLIGPRGRSLSGGERQRLALARALVRDASVLLLDEATSALDSENEHLIQTALARASKGRTTLVIAHRLATVRRADRILVMESGRLVETGTHEDLVAKQGLYARLSELQFGI